jgi:hypothetical protein
MVRSGLIDMTRGWSWVGASRCGSSHVARGERRQDAWRVLHDKARPERIVAIACDGAGSARFGGPGAVIAARRISHNAAKDLTRLGSVAALSDETVACWLDATRDAINATAHARGLQSRDFSCTMVLVIADGSDILIAHVGDGAVVVRDGDAWRAGSWPETGEYASTTYFLTDPSGPRLRLSRCEANIDAIALFTDGIESLVLAQARKEVLGTFFDGICSQMHGAPIGRLEALSRRVGDFLDSDRVLARTDDDKTLIVLQRTSLSGSSATEKHFALAHAPQDGTSPADPVANSTSSNAHSHEDRPPDPVDPACGDLETAAEETQANKP